MVIFVQKIILAVFYGVRFGMITFDPTLMAFSLPWGSIVCMAVVAAM